MLECTVAQARLKEVFVGRSKKTGNEFAIAKFASLELGDMQFFCPMERITELRGNIGSVGRVDFRLKFNNGREELELGTFSPMVAGAK